MKAYLIKNLSDRHFWIKSGVFLLIIVSIASCDPVLLKAFWLWKGEIADTVNFWRKVFPYVISLLSLALIIRRRGKNNYGALFLILLVYSGYYISSYANGLGFFRPWGTFLMSCEMFLLAMVCCSDEEGKRLYLHAGSDVFLIVALANLLLTYVLFKVRPEYMQINGEYQEVFTGNRNNFGYVLDLGMLFCLLDDHISATKRSHIKLIVYVILLVINTYSIHKCATAVIGTAILLIYFLPPLRRLTEKTPFTVFLGVNVLLFIVLMFFFDEFTSFAPVRFLVTQVLHKKITFTGRVYVWQGVLEEIRQHPIIGYGMRGGSFYFDDIYNHSMVHCHNQYLQAWHEAGILGLVTPLVLLGFTGWRLHRCEDHRLAGIFKIILFVLMLTLQTDQITSCPYYLLCITAHLALLLIPAENKSEKSTESLPVKA